MLPARPQGSFAASAHALDHWLRTVASASPALTPRLNVELCSTPVCSSALITDIPGCSSQLHRAEFGPLHLLALPCRAVSCHFAAPDRRSNSQKLLCQPRRPRGFISCPALPCPALSSLTLFPLRVQPRDQSTAGLATLNSQLAISRRNWPSCFGEPQQVLYFLNVTLES